MAVKMEKISPTTYKVPFDEWSEVEVGDIKSKEFKPHLKIKKWGDECYLAIYEPKEKVNHRYDYQEIECDIDDEKIFRMYPIEEPISEPIREFRYIKIEAEPYFGISLLELYRHLKIEQPVIIAWKPTGKFISFNGKYPQDKYVFPEKIEEDRTKIRAYFGQQEAGTSVHDENSLIIFFHFPIEKEVRFITDLWIDSTIDVLRRYGINAMRSPHRPNSNDVVFVKDGKIKKFSGFANTYWSENARGYVATLLFSDDLGPEGLYKLDSPKMKSRGEVLDIHDILGGLWEVREDLDINKVIDEIIERIGEKTGYGIVKSQLTDKEKEVVENKIIPLVKDPEWIENANRGDKDDVEEMDNIKWHIKNSEKESRHKVKCSKFEFEIVLKKKPKNNRIELKIETKGLKFYYQPPLHPEHPTWSDEDGDGIPDHFRPIDVVGSYAVYHETKSTGIWKSKEEAKKYKCGKAFHIYRPKVIDAKGNSVWADLHIDEKRGIMTIEIPQDFLDRAEYPIKIDPTFGYTTGGSSNTSVGNYTIRASVFTCPESGTVESMSWYGQHGGDPMYLTKYRCVIYRDSDNSRVDYSALYQYHWDDSVDAWHTYDSGWAGASLSNEDYWLGLSKGDTEFGGPHLNYDTGDTNQGAVEWNNVGNDATPPASVGWDAYFTDKYSIYCTYSVTTVYYKTLSVIEASVVSLLTATQFFKSLITSVTSSVVLGTTKMISQMLNVVESSVVGITKGARHFVSLSAIESGLVNLATKTKHFIGLVVSEISVAAINRLSKLKRVLSVIENSLASLTTQAKHFISLVVSEVSSITISTTSKFFRTLSVIVSGSSVISLAKKFFRTLSTTITGVVSITIAKFFKRTLDVIESSLVTLTRTAKHFITLSVVGTGIVSMAIKKFLYRTLSVIEGSIASLQRKLFKRQVLSVVSSGVVSLERTAKKFITLSVVGVSSVVLMAIKTFSQVLSVIEVSVVSLLRKIKITLAVSMIGSATIGVFKALFRTLSVVMTSVASLQRGLFLSRTLSVVESSVVILSGKIRKFITLSVVGTVSANLSRVAKKYFFRVLSASVVSIPSLVVGFLEKIPKGLRKILPYRSHEFRP